MALAAIAIKSQDTDGKRRKVVVDVTVNAYATGGQPITPAAVGLSSFEDVSIVGGSAAAAGFVWWWDNVNGKLMASTSAAGALAEVANATDLSTSIIRMEFVGN